MAVRRSRTVLFVIAGLVAVAAGIAWWWPSEAQLARRAEAALAQSLGVPVTIGTLHWQLLPQPWVEVRDVATQQEAPIRLRRLGGRPLLQPLLLHRRIAFSRVEVDGATIPQASLRAFHGADRKAADGAGRWTPAALPVQRAEFRDVAWVGRRGIPLEFEGHADFDAGWRPRSAFVARPGTAQPATLALARDGAADRWRATVAIGGGSWDGTLALDAAAAAADGTAMRLTGELEPRNVEVQQMLAAFKRSSVVAGRALGRTTLSAEGADVGTLVRSLCTRTTFAMAPATVLGFDLDRAIRSVGKEHAGRTPLDRLSGQVETRNTEDGMVLRYTGLKATSGALTATGSATLANRRIDAELAVDLVEGVVGVPLKITGPVDRPQIAVPPGAVAGAVAGTAVLPGVGTAIGARLGGFIGKLFGGGDDAPPAPPKATRR